MQSAVLATANLSVCPSIRLSVTFRCFVQRNEDTIMRSSASGSRASCYSKVTSLLYVSENQPDVLTTTITGYHLHPWHPHVTNWHHSRRPFARWQAPALGAMIRRKKTSRQSAVRAAEPFNMQPTRRVVCSYLDVVLWRWHQALYNRPLGLLPSCVLLQLHKSRFKISTPVLVARHSYARFRRERMLYGKNCCEEQTNSIQIKLLYSLHLT